MKRTGVLHIFAIIALFTSCLNTSKHFTKGNQFSGKNKIVKQEFEQFVQNDLQTTQLTQIKDKTEEGKIKLFPDKPSNPDSTISAKEKEKSKNKVSHELKFSEIKNQIEEVNKSIKKNDSFSTRAAEEEGNGGKAITTILIVIFVLLVLIILLGYILFQLFIKALNQAAEDTVEEACYVATMAYGSYDHPKVMTLRVFRDDFLAQRKWGRKFIKWYYRNSPSFVAIAKNHRITNIIIRGCLNVFEFTLRPFYKK